MKRGIEEVWGRIVANEGESFHQIKGGEYTYTVKGNLISLSRTNRSIGKSVF
jgi:hypothetical protein